jgi:outer membrane protein OmpA-like peptidoglycan-associated protein
MKTRSLLIGALAPLAVVSAASANGQDGWYVGLEGGGNWIQDTSVVRTIDFPPLGDPFVAPPNKFQFDTGWAAFATVGRGFSSHWRLELEGGYRDNSLQPNAAGNNMSLREWSAMLNALYDIPVTDRFSVSLGMGLGGDRATLERKSKPFRDSDWNFAYQGIGGISYELTDRLDLFANYRYFRVMEPTFSDISPLDGPALERFELGDLVKHSATIGLRYHFGAPEMVPVAAPPSMPPTQPAEAQEFIVFFGHNKSNLTSQAQQVIQQAVAAAKKFGSASISVVGHADRSGSDSYNMRLSQRRASVVKDALVSQGIPGGAITTSAKGESEPLVPTADGVREPQNRRVHINL